MWWQETVIYEVYVRSFHDSDGDGVGDLAGVLERLDYLAELGVDAVWLTPIHPSPDADVGYDVADCMAVDQGLGTHADVDRFLRTAHARGMRVPCSTWCSTTPPTRIRGSRPREHRARTHGGPGRVLSGTARSDGRPASRAALAHADLLGVTIREAVNLDEERRQELMTAYRRQPSGHRQRIP